jgi:thiamine-phosphate diphosphorylase
VKPAVPRLHAVTDKQVLSFPDFAARARAIATAGDVALHARAGAVDASQLIALANLLHETGALVVVNDRADVARFVAAGGVHLPAAGLPPQRVREMLGPEVVIGRSTHDPGEAREAHEAGADYVFLGPIWPTASHPERVPLGVDAIAAAAPARVIAIGGVTPERAALCREAGAWGVAAISGLWGADDSGEAARMFLVSLGG